MRSWCGWITNQSWLMILKIPMFSLWFSCHFLPPFSFSRARERRSFFSLSNPPFSYCLLSFLSVSLTVKVHLLSWERERKRESSLYTIILHCYKTSAIQKVLSLYDLRLLFSLVLRKWAVFSKSRKPSFLHLISSLNEDVWNSRISLGVLSNTIQRNPMFYWSSLVGLSSQKFAVGNRKYKEIGCPKISNPKQF